MCGGAVGTETEPPSADLGRGVTQGCNAHSAKHFTPGKLAFLLLPRQICLCSAPACFKKAPSRVVALLDTRACGAQEVAGMEPWGLALLFVHLLPHSGPVAFRGEGPSAGGT